MIPVLIINNKNDGDDIRFIIIIDKTDATDKKLRLLTLKEGVEIAAAVWAQMPCSTFCNAFRKTGTLSARLLTSFAARSEPQNPAAADAEELAIMDELSNMFQAADFEIELSKAKEWLNGGGEYRVEISYKDLLEETFAEIVWINQFSSNFQIL